MSQEREFTGRHMLFFVLGFFAVIIAVNLTLAAFALTSWTGLVVPNSYVASQHFNERLAEARREAALGWTAELTVAGGKLVLRLSDKAGRPISGLRVTARIGHPSRDRDDKTVVFEPARNGQYRAPTGLAPGIWSADVVASDGARRRLRRIFRFQVDG